MAKCNQLSPLHFEGLTQWAESSQFMVDYFCWQSDLLYWWF